MTMVGYYPGCSLTGTAREFDESVRAVAGELGVALVEVNDWSCCGASSAHAVNRLLGLALPARNLALAEEQGLTSLLAPCAACYGRLSATRYAAATEQGLTAQLSSVIERPFKNSITIENPLAFFQNLVPQIREAIAASPEPNPLAGAKLACYYGCLLLRPAEVCAYDDPERPTSMDGIVEACGAEPVSWNMKTECCGAGLSIARTSSVIRLGRSIINDARANGAEAIVVSCPMCHSNLDLRQKAMAERGVEPLPILYLPQAIGLAMGLAPSALGLKRHFIDTAPLLKRLTARAAEARAEAERKALAAAEKKRAAASSSAGGGGAA